MVSACKVLSFWSVVQVIFALTLVMLACDNKLLIDAE